MNLKINLLFLSVLFFLFFSFILVNSEGLDSIELKKGKNLVKINISEPFYADSLIKLNPNIEAVSYTEENKTIGYINIFGGVGENFIIQKDREYEIIAKKDISLILPVKLE